MGTVIKKGAAAKMVSRFQPIALRDHVAEARAHLAAARTQAEQIIKDARTQAARLQVQAREKAYEQGRREGVRDGLEAGRAEAFERVKADFAKQQADLVQTLTSLVEQIEAQKARLLERAKRDTLSFAFAVAGRIVGSAARSQDGVVQQNLDKALRQVSARTDLTIRVHPDDLERISTYVESIPETVRQQRHWSIQPDDRLQPGGCVVETPIGSVDASIETQLHSAAELLFGAAETCDETDPPGVGS